MAPAPSGRGHSFVSVEFRSCRVRRYACPRSVVVVIRPTSLISIEGCVVSHATRLGQQNKLASAAALGTARVEKER